MEEATDKKSAMIGRDAVNAIVVHYSQTIHLGSQLEAPYYDPLLGNPAQQLSRITALWVEKVTDACTLVDPISIGMNMMDSNAWDSVSRCYTITKRDITMTESCSVVLLEYEQLLCHYLDVTNGKFNEKANVASSDCILHYCQQLYIVIFRITSDLLLLTNLERIKFGTISESETKEQNEKKKFMMSNVILPTLLRILQHCVSFYFILYERLSEEHGDEGHKTLLAICSFATLLFCKDQPFIKNKMGQKAVIELTSYSLHISELLADDFFEELTLHHIIFGDALYSPTNVTTDSTYLEELKRCSGLKSFNNSFLDASILNWREAEDATYPMKWLDHTKGIGVRSAISLLQTLGGISMSLSVQDEKENVELMCFRDLILDYVGVELVSRLNKEMFFGRLFKGKSKYQEEKAIERHSFEPSRSLAFNGIIVRKKVSHESDYELQSYTKRDISKKQDSMKASEDMKDIYGERSLQASQSRIIASIRVLSSIQSRMITEETMSNGLPIAFALIDSIETHRQLFGAGLLYSLLSGNNSNTKSSYSFEMDNRMKNIKEVLDAACRTASVSLTLYIMFKCSCIVHSYVPRKSKVDILKHSLSLSLERLQVESRRGPGRKSSELEIVSVMLIGSISPLLHELSIIPDAPCMEVFRLGLCVMLPILRWEADTDAARSIQIMTLMSLVSLMISSHPLVPRHGGKIMSELLSSIGRITRQSQIKKQVQNSLKRDDEDDPRATSTLFAFIHVSSIASIMCGERGNEILSMIENGKYEEVIKTVCSNIRTCSAKLPNRS